MNVGTNSLSSLNKILKTINAHFKHVFFIKQVCIGRNYFIILRGYRHRRVFVKVESRVRMF